MSKHGAKCPKCGHRLDFNSADGDTLTCPGCQAALRAPRRAPAGDTPTATPESHIATEGGAPPPPGPEDPFIGKSLDEFEIREPLGRGGMGAVYKAWQPSLERFVAIKVLSKTISGDHSFIERFVREARNAAAITHTNIIEVHAIGRDKEHQYIAMELVEGGSLEDMIRLDGPLPPARALDIMRQVTSALAAAHECGILHRDIKPANILFTKRDRAKVADFGLAKHEGVDLTLTQTGQLLGTPRYLPPEPARGQRLDTRSDLYSLGATFYHALAGKPPFDGATTLELSMKHVEAPVPPLHKLAPHVPRGFCRVIHRLLRKNPAERYQTADELLQALDRVAQAPSPVGAVAQPPLRQGSGHASAVTASPEAAT